MCVTCFSAKKLTRVLYIGPIGLDSWGCHESSVKATFYIPVRLSCWGVIRRGRQGVGKLVLQFLRNYASETESYKHVLQYKRTCLFARLRGVVMAAILKLWRCIRNPPSQSMHIYLKNLRVIFHCDPIWSDGSSGFFFKRTPQKEQHAQDA